MLKPLSEILPSCLEAAKTLQPSRCDTPRPPAIVDREADYEIPLRVWENWIPAIGDRAITRPLTFAERALLTRRAEELEPALLPFVDRNRVGAILSAMLSGFRSMRYEFGENAENIVQVLMGVLREFPAWAIERACEQIMRDDSEIDPKWPPNDAQVYQRVARVVAPYRKALSAAQALLCAPVGDQVIAPKTKPKGVLKPIPSRPCPAPYEEPPGDGRHMERVMADLAARKAKRESAPTEQNGGAA